MQKDRLILEEQDTSDFKAEILRYVSFWPYLLLLSIIFFSTAFLYLRYTSFTTKSTTVIEIMDESQNREMALPTELTVFNRSMINLENEINRFNSFGLNLAVVKNLKANVLYYDVGRLKNTQTTSEFWFDKYELDFKINTDLIEYKSSYFIYVEQKNGNL